MLNLYLSGEADREWIAEIQGDNLLLALEILDETIPGMSPQEVTNAVYGEEDCSSPEEIQEAYNKLDETNWEGENFQETAAELMDLLLTNINLSEVIDLDPYAELRTL